MGMQVNHNISSLNAYRNLNNTQNDLSKSLEKLSSGLRINRAADDAAGLAISEGLRSQISGVTVAQRNAQDGISVVQTAEGALTEVHTILHRLRDLAVQASNTVTNQNADSLAGLNKEANALIFELGRISEDTNFNGQKLLEGGTLTFQVGAGGTASDSSRIDVTLANVSTVASNLGYVDATTAVNPFTDVASATDFIDALDTEISTVSQARADLGAQQNRFESTIRSLSVSQENLTAAESRIRDTDMASEMSNYTRASILSQAGTAMLAQANQAGQGVLRLLQ